MSQAHEKSHYRELEEEVDLSASLASIRENLTASQETAKKTGAILQEKLKEAKDPETRNLIKKTIRIIRAGRVRL